MLKLDDKYEANRVVDQMREGFPDFMDDSMVIEAINDLEKHVFVSQPDKAPTYDKGVESEDTTTTPEVVSPAEMSLPPAGEEEAKRYDPAQASPELEKFQRLVADHPNSATAHYDLATALYAEGDNGHMEGAVFHALEVRNIVL
jgi:hypothetical protein